MLRYSLRSFLILFIIGGIWTAYVQWRIHDALDQQLPEHADVGIVLGASIWHDEPSPGLKERLNHSIKLYQYGYFDHIIVTGGMDASGAIITEAEAMKRYLVNHGIPEDSIMLEGKSTSTYENLVNAKQIMDTHDWRSAIIVTHHFHGARALDIARTVGLSSYYISTTDSKALFMPWHQARETLAFAKWEWTKLFIH
ncbi:YdcF family protein [Paenibacillus albiflavus]|uniref:YdcF family protein n=1 Tax=Paenibacillus albiflavus TaxID=2545760 RepID=A0A4R4ENW1_9BACL|nr:YdcF family protein [Paenibacillus albiflavus]